MSILKNEAADLQAAAMMAYAGAMNKACRELDDGIALCDAATKASDTYKAATTIQIEVKSVYGNDLIYPANDAAKALARIAGKKTLSVENIKDACALGLEVVEVNRNYAPIANLLAA